MKALIVFDSLYGNTEKVAQAIAKGLKTKAAVEVKDLQKVKVEELKGLDLLVIGTPTHGGQPTPAMQAFLKQLPKEVLQLTKIACFDTRIVAEDVGFWLKILIKVIDYAAPKMVKTLKAKGANMVLAPEGFVVKGKEGPLKPGELERAEAWGSVILS